MNGFNPFLADVYSAFAPGAQLAGVAPPTAAPIVSGKPLPVLAPPPNATGFPSLTEMPPTPPPQAPIGPPAPPVASSASPPGMSSPYEDPNKLVSQAPPAVSQGPAPTPVSVGVEPPKVGAPSVNADPGAFPLISVGGSGVTPAHEVDLRGPSLTNAQNVANATTLGAIGANSENTHDRAAGEYDMALDQERQARMREAAWQQSVAERDEELSARQADFDQSVTALSKMSVDPHRFWATRSTGQKIGAMVSLALGGFLQGARGGNNPGMDVINTAIDRDVRAQESAYQAARDTASMRQTAFSTAMQKYQNVDAARSMARAAAIDTVQAQFAQNAALWKDADSANRANIAMAELQNNRMQQVAQGIRFILPQAQARTFVDPKTGLRYTEAEAKGLAHELRGYEQKREEIGLNTAGDIIKENSKADATARGKSHENAVVLPNGETVYAPDVTEAGKLRDLVDSTNNARRLISEAKQIRGESITGVPLTPAARGRLSQIQKDLVTGFAVQNKLGALSNEDMKLAVGGTADLFEYGPGVEARLDRLGETTTAKLHSRLKTLPGAPAKATGQMPSSTSYHGGK